MALALSPATAEAARDRVGPLVAPLTKKARREFGGPFLLNVPPSIPFRSRGCQLASRRIAERPSHKRAPTIAHWRLSFRERTSHASGPIGPSHGPDTCHTRVAALPPARKRIEGIMRFSKSAMPAAAIMLETLAPLTVLSPGPRLAGMPSKGRKIWELMGIDCPPTRTSTSGTAANAHRAMAR